MNFDFSDELKQVRAEARAFLAEHAAGSARRALEGGGFDRTLWQRIASLGWIGAAIPEDWGGSALGAEGLCVLAEEIGASLAPFPFASNAYLVSQAILRFGDPAQRQRFLPKLCDGSLIGCWALAEGAGAPSADAIAVRYEAGALHGAKQPVTDGNVADLAVVVARDGADIVLALAELDGTASRDPLETLDPSRPAARLHFDATPATLLPGARGWPAVQSVLDYAAIPFAFEQLGGAQAALDAAVAYARERQAFGRPIGSFQAIKHKLADVYVAVELARSNAYYGAWALDADAPDLPAAAAAARVAASKAFRMASEENIQVHGGAGFTWEYDCHLFYRRAKHLALAIGAAPFWKERLMASLERRNAA